MMKITVRAFCTHNQNIDDALYSAVGRVSDFSGCGTGGARDHGWVCETEIEAHRIKNAIKNIGYFAEIRKETP